MKTFPLTYWSLRMPNLEEIRQKIEEDVDYIYSKRFDYSLAKLLERYPEGAPTKVIAQSLLMTEEEVEVLFEGVIQKLRTIMKVEDGEEISLSS